MYTTREILSFIISKRTSHAKWLNTLSLMENSGARKIAFAEDSVHVTELMLKHASEEARHAYFLKRQINKLDGAVLPDYSPEYILAFQESRHYLHTLDIYTSRYLKNTLHLTGSELRYCSYLLVTYAIEVRADELYPVYQQELEKTNSRVNVKSIIAEEEGHLAEMIVQLKTAFQNWESHASVILEFEKKLFSNWMRGLCKELHLESRKSAMEQV